MQQIAKKIDQHTQHINNIQAGFRYSRMQNHPFVEGFSADLPPIASVSLTFPITSKESPRRTHSIHAPTASRAQLQLETILGNNSINFRDVAGCEINRIIFARPPHVLQQTKPRFRSSIYAPVDTSKDYEISQKFPKQGKYWHKMSIKHSPRAIKQSPWQFIHPPIQRPTEPLPQQQKESKKEQWDKIVQTTSNEWIIHKSKVKENRSRNFSTLAESNPEAVSKNRRKMEKTLRTLHKQVLSNARTGRIERFSPWRGEELQEQLII